MATLIEADSPLSKEAITRLLDIARVHPQTYQYQAPVCSCQKDFSSSKVDGGARDVPKCGLWALSCAQVSLDLWSQGFRGTEFVHQILSHNTVKHINDVVNTIDAPFQLDLDDLLKHPVFISTINVQRKTALNTLLSAWFLSSLDELSIVICQRVSEVFTCLVVPYQGSLLYAVFNPHPAGIAIDQPSGPVFVLSKEMTDITALEPFTAVLPTQKPIESSLNALEKQEEAFLSVHSPYLNLHSTSDVPSHAPLSLPNTSDHEQVNDKGLTLSHPNDTISTSSNFHPSKQKERWHGLVTSICSQDDHPLSLEKGTTGNLYPSTDSLLKSLLVLRPSSPMSQDTSLSSFAAGPSRVGSPESRIYSLDVQSIETPDVETPHNALIADEWQLALLQQLQEEEEIAIVAGNHLQISHDNAWLVAVQKQRRTEQATVVTGLSSTSVVSFDLDWQLAVQLQEAERGRPPRARRPISTDIIIQPTDSSQSLPLPHANTFECKICCDNIQDDLKISLVVCGHSYCKDCLTGLVKSKIADSRFPIFCPECLIDRSVRNKCHVNREALEQLDLSETDLKRIEDLEILSHSVILECFKCRQRMDMPRGDYSDKKVISCTELDCSYHWCKNCNKGLATVQEKHKCKNESIDRLMRRKGWKYCPGCRTPVQKETGCNHMTCGAPGCNVHFCYKCGVLIVDTTHGGDVGLTVTEHYANSKCRLFDRRFLSCTIM